MDTTDPDPDPDEELANRRADLDALAERLGLIPPAEGWPHHQAEREWWTGQLGAYANSDTISTDEALEAITIMSRWHLAWVKAQPQYGRGQEMLVLSQKLGNLARYIMEPDDHPNVFASGEAATLDEIITRLSAIRDTLTEAQPDQHE